MRNYAAFILSVLTIPFSMGCTLIYDTSKFPLQDGKRPAVMLFWESVHPLSFLVRDSRWVSFAPMTWLRGGSTAAHGG